MNNDTPLGDGGSSDDYTVEEQAVHVEGDTGRPEVFIETRPKGMPPVGDVTLLRDDAAWDLYCQLGDYLSRHGYPTGTVHADARDADAYEITYTLWEKGDEASTNPGGHTGEQVTETGFFQGESPIDSLNALLYETRGVKTGYEVAYINEIQPMQHDEDTDSEDSA